MTASRITHTPISRRGSFCATTSKGTVRINQSTTGETAKNGDPHFVLTVTKDDRDKNGTFEDKAEVFSEMELYRYFNKTFTRSNKKHKIEFHVDPKDAEPDGRVHIHFSLDNPEELESATYAVARRLSDENIDDLRQIFKEAKEKHYTVLVRNMEVFKELPENHPWNQLSEEEKDKMALSLHNDMKYTQDTPRECLDKRCGLSIITQVERKKISAVSKMEFMKDLPKDHPWHKLPKDKQDKIALSLHDFFKYSSPDNQKEYINNQCHKAGYAVSRPSLPSQPIVEKKPATATKLSKTKEANQNDDVIQELDLPNDHLWHVQSKETQNEVLKFLNGTLKYPMFSRKYQREYLDKKCKKPTSTLLPKTSLPAFKPKIPPSIDIGSQSAENNGIYFRLTSIASRVIGHLTFPFGGNNATNADITSKKTSDTSQHNTSGKVQKHISDNETEYPPTPSTVLC